MNAAFGLRAAGLAVAIYGLLIGRMKFKLGASLLPMRFKYKATSQM
jgi:hypothetical protein